MPTCQNCGNRFPNRIMCEGKQHNLQKRRFCPDCSPLGQNNRRKYILPQEPGKAFCVRCQRQKNRNEFHSRKNGTPLSYCKQCSSEVKILKHEERLDKIITQNGGMCADCGSIFPAYVFVFIKDGKPLPLNVMKNMSWRKLCAYLEGTAMVCRNCAIMRDWESNNV